MHTELEESLSDEMKETRRLAQMQNLPEWTLRPEFAKEALVLLTPMDWTLYKNELLNKKFKKK